MDEKRSSADIHALFGRLGLSATAYREFLADAPVASKPTAQAELPARASEPAEPVILPRQPVAVPAAELRWSGLDALAEQATPARQAPLAAPRIALYSRAGGVGRSTLAASMARLLAGRGRHVVLGDVCPSPATEYLLPASAPRFGRLAFLHVPGPDAVPVSVLNLGDTASVQPVIADPAIFALEQAAATADVVLFDIPSSPGAAAEFLLRSADVILVPLLPDVSSTASVTEILRSLASFGPHIPDVRFVMNRFDDSRSFHRRVRSQVERIAGHRLLDLSIREEHLISEALADRLTVLDYAPTAPVVGDLERLAAWVAERGGKAGTAAKSQLAGAVA